MIRILLVDDQNIMRQGLQALLELKPTLKIVGTAQDGLSAIAQVKNLQPDIVLMDIEMPGMSGIDTTKEITRQFPATKVLILSSHEDKKHISQASKAGAKGYLLKNIQAEDLERAILSVYQGHSQIESQILGESLAATSPSLLNISAEPSLSNSADGRSPESHRLDYNNQYSKNGSSPKIKGTQPTSDWESSELEPKSPVWSRETLEPNKNEPEPQPPNKKDIFPKLSRWWIMGLAAVPILMIVAITTEFTS